MIKAIYRQNAGLRLRSTQLSRYDVKFFELMPRQKIPRSDEYPKTLVYTQTSFGNNIDQSHAIESPYAYGGSLQPGPINNRLIKT